jgi:hypothetical protein
MRLNADSSKINSAFKSCVMVRGKITNARCVYCQVEQPGILSLKSTQGFSTKDHAPTPGKAGCVKSFTQAANLSTWVWLSG